MDESEDKIMACPQCLNDTLRKFVEITISIPASMNTITKTDIRSKSVEVLTANWDKARWYCTSCGWYMREDTFTESFGVDIDYAARGKIGLK
jgi:hypothetical protein